jgi:hypothetical protein
MMTRFVPATVINAFHYSAQDYNAAQNRVLVHLRFFIGQSSHPLLDDNVAVDSTFLTEGHINRFKRNRFLPKFVKGAFPENMDEGKTREWFRWAAEAFPSSHWILKVDTDVSIDWFKFGAFLARNVGSGLRYVGYVNDRARCGGYEHCPPEGCKDMKGDCWIYMSGGLYGASTQLAKVLNNCSYYKQHAIGYEDLQFGMAVKHCVQNIDSLRVIKMPVGTGWCHSKSVTQAQVRLGKMPNGC